MRSHQTVRCIPNNDEKKLSKFLKTTFIFKKVLNTVNRAVLVEKKTFFSHHDAEQCSMNI